MSPSLHPAADAIARPPRLQPSPSLPNLRARNFSSDPHSACLHPAPSSSQIPSLNPAKLSPNISTKDADPHPNKRSRPQSKNHHYLTPPLTPASSLRSDNSDSDPPDPSPPGDPSLSTDSPESRFLIIGNVPNDLSEDVIGPYFHSLAALPADSSPARADPQSAPNPGNVIQTIYYRFQEKRAVLLAFYDIRDAQRVKHLIETGGSRSLSIPEADDEQRTSCDGTVSGTWVEGLTCLFVVPDHFLQLLGQPAAAAVTHTEGVFCVSADGTMVERDHNYSGWSRTRFFVPVKLKSVLAKYGEIKSFCLLKEDGEKCNQFFMVEYYDVRAGDLAWENLDGRVVDNMKLRLVPRGVLRGGYSEPRDLEIEGLVSLEGHLGGGLAAEPNTPTASTYLFQSQTSSGVPFPLLNDVGACDYPASCEREGTDATSLDLCSVTNGHKSSISDRQKPVVRYPVDIVDPLTDETLSVDKLNERGGLASDQLGRRGSNNLFFDAVRSRTHHRPADLDCTRTANMNSIALDQSQVCPFEATQVAGGTTDLCTPPCPGAQPRLSHDYFTHTDRYGADTSMQSSWVSLSLAQGMQYPLSPQSPMPPVCSSICWDASTGTWVAWGAPGILPEHWSAFPTSSGYYHGTPSQTVPYPYPPHTSPPLPHHPYAPASNRVYPPTYPASPRAPPENNQLDTRKIELGLDTRTTVMIKNIPNKMTDKELIAYINRICPRRIDFLYLRMDFQNGCNVGYAFVNFIGVEDLLRFAKTTLGEKWNMYSSEKVLQMSYANYQGKEALVEKFKNSCIMDEREEWRPKIFYSDPGPKQGLPEEFPKPTHMRRKERSSYNRGALFVPGLNGGAGYPKTFLNAATASHQRASRSAAPQGDERSRKLNYSNNNNNVQ